MNSICFDTETTGLHPNGSDPDEILTISIIGRDGSVLLDERFRPTTSDTSGRAGRTGRLPCSDGSNNGS